MMLRIKRDMYVKRVRFRDLMEVVRLEKEIYPADGEYNGILGTFELYLRGVIFGLHCEERMVGYCIMVRTAKKHWKVFDFAVLDGFRLGVFVLGRAMTAQIPVGYSVEMHCREKTSLVPVLKRATEYGYEVSSIKDGEKVGDLQGTEVRGRKILQNAWEEECLEGIYS